MLSYFPNFFSSVNLWNRTRSRADKLADELTVLFPGLSINVYDNPVACVEDADVIVTATNSSTALFSARDLKKSSVHINGELLNLLPFFRPREQNSSEKSILQNSRPGP
jgi:ornithine cyclodeaminase/alanine dehydrogenase-like protein (mu-crystallin family)